MWYAFVSLKDYSHFLTSPPVLEEVRKQVNVGTLYLCSCVHQTSANTYVFLLKKFHFNPLDKRKEKEEEEAEVLLKKVPVVLTKTQWQNQNTVLEPQPM